MVPCFDIFLGLCCVVLIGSCYPVLFRSPCLVNCLKKKWNELQFFSISLSAISEFWGRNKLWQTKVKTYLMPVTLVSGYCDQKSFPILRPSSKLSTFMAILIEINAWWLLAHFPDSTPVKQVKHINGHSNRNHRVVIAHFPDSTHVKQVKHVNGHSCLASAAKASSEQ